MAKSTYSGKFIVRVPASLHRALVQEAKREGMSLNSYALYLLSGGVRKQTVAVTIAGKRRTLHIGVPAHPSAHLWETPKGKRKQRRHA